MAPSRTSPADPSPAARAEASPATGGSLWRTVRAVGWAFLGVRRNADYQQDMVRLNPFHVVGVALAAAGLLVAGLVGLVHWIV